ncbi:SDR family oxidoreductase [Brevibacterium atlanticum]|uniref:SDR family oxidoreductase n=1 Tax=Brevibacterium atlanticum TaxID=2697563 RepID=UPI00141D7635|nr:NAD(P)H-binding protein [Brevibacterium atlanticum]
MNENQRPRVLVTGASGRVGGSLSGQLSSRGVRVRAATRNPGSLRAGIAHDVAAVDLAEPTTLEPALDDVDAVFLMWPFFESEEDARRKVAPIAEILGKKVPRVVYLSAQGVEEDRSNFWSVVEDAIADHVEEWTMLRPTGFAANARQWVTQIAAGDVVRWPFGQMARPLIHETDMAAVAVEALINDGHHGRDYVITGPELISQEEQVDEIGTAIGRKLHWEETDRGRAAAEFDLPEVMLDAWERLMDDPEPITDEVERLVGRPALTFAEWARDNAGEFR